MKSALGWVALGVTVIALAFTVRPVHASGGIFALCLGVGVCLLCVPLLVRLRTARQAKSKLLSLAAEARDLYSTLGVFLAERRERRPRATFGNGTRVRRWEQDVVRRYTDQYRHRGDRVVAELIANDGASPRARTLVGAESVEQIESLRVILLEGAELIERTAHARRG